MLMWPKASTTPSLPRMRFATTRSRIAAGTRSFMTRPSTTARRIASRRGRAARSLPWSGVRLLHTGELQQHPVGLERDRIETNSRGVPQRIAERGRDRIVRALAHRLGAVRAHRVAGLGEIDLLTRDVGKR